MIELLGAGRWSRNARRGLALVGVAGLVLAAMPAPSPAQEAEMTRGTGRATASLVMPQLTAGNLAVNVVLGEAAASYQDEGARGTSTSLDLPIFKTAGSLTVCGKPGFDLGALLPPAIVADTAPTDNAKAVAAASPRESSTILAQETRATPGSRGTARTHILDLDTPILGLSGIEAVADTGVDVATQTRFAEARTEVGSIELLGGLIRLEGLRWELRQTQVGPDSRHDERAVNHRFTMGAIVISGLEGLGLPLGGLLGRAGEIRLPVESVGDLPGVLKQANRLLAPLGVVLRLPEYAKVPDSDKHSLSPLTVAIGGRESVLVPVLSQLLNLPFVTQVQNQTIETLFDPATCNQLGGLMKGIPDLNSLYNTLGSFAPMLFALLTGVLTGGEVQINVGGVATQLDDTYFPPLDFGGPSFGGPPAAAPAAPSPGAAPIPEAVRPAPAPAAPEPVADPAPEIVAGPVSTVCATTSPAGRPGCWAGDARLAIGIAAITTLGLLVADEVWRRRRTAPTAAPQEP